MCDPKVEVFFFFDTFWLASAFEVLGMEREPSLIGPRAAGGGLVNHSYSFDPLAGRSSFKCRRCRGRESCLVKMFERVNGGR